MKYFADREVPSARTFNPWNRTLLAMVAGLFCANPLPANESDTLPALVDGQAPISFSQLWADFDPRAEPLEVELLKQWEEQGTVLRIVRFRIGIFKGKKATLAAIYGFPKNAVDDGRKLPGLIQIHGGGQYADHKACLANARRGYATISIAWAGRISAPGYRVSPKEVQLFWEGDTDNPAYRETTDWGAVDGYHAPGRNEGNQFPSLRPASWTLDPVESPRNSGWFLCALAARRALTFLEQQPEVDATRLGVYGHSMGGKLTVMTAFDPRVKAAAPSCGGISDRDSGSELFRRTLGDNVSLAKISCPIFFLSPANDFHGRIGDLPTAIAEIQSNDWRVTCAPHHNHQDTAEYEVATLLWMDQHLKHSFLVPQTPRTKLRLISPDGVPVFTVQPDASRRVLGVDVYYTTQGKADETPRDRLDTMHRFWHHAVATPNGDSWTAKLPLDQVDQPLWVYANVRYPLDKPVSGVGYYYGTYSTDAFSVSSLLQVVNPGELAAAGCRQSLKSTVVIEDFENGWEREWFTYRPSEWARTTNKLNSKLWKAPEGAMLALSVQSAEANRLVVLLDGFAAEVKLDGKESPQRILLRASDFQDYAGNRLATWNGIRQLKLSASERLRSGRGQSGADRVLGAVWKGPPPVFHDLSWHVSYSFLDMPNRSAGQLDYDWTTDHMHVGVRWQPYAGRPMANAYDATRPVIAVNSSYVQFWASWAAVEPTEAHVNYEQNPSPGLQVLDRAVDACNARGLKVEFVFFHAPAWASESGQAGGHKPIDGLFEQYAERMATHFKGRVHAWQLYHEANLEGLMKGADIDFMINDILLKGARTIRRVYEAEPAKPVLVSTTGMSPCEPCGARKGLNGKGAKAVNQFYDLMIGHDELMKTVDALNMNVSDHSTGFGNMDGMIIPSVWAQYDLVRGKLDAAGYGNKSILAAESWITWDDARGNTHDINGDGLRNEQDAYEKAVTIFGQCLQRGLNTINLPWSDNSSSWAMGLTKRRDYNGRIRQLNPDITVPARDGGPDVVTTKVSLRGNDERFSIVDGSGNVFTVENYSDPSDPNHVHYYIWRWYAQIAGGTDEVIRHAVAGEKGNDIIISGAAFESSERFRIASWNRTRRIFTVLVYANEADGDLPAKVTIPARIQTGRHSNTDASRTDFRGEGFADGSRYITRIITKDISRNDGSDVDPRMIFGEAKTVTNGTLTVMVPNMNRFTAIEFISSEDSTDNENSTN